jgi:hypothetical protein
MWQNKQAIPSTIQLKSSYLWHRREKIHTKPLKVGQQCDQLDVIQQTHPRRRSLHNTRPPPPPPPPLNQICTQTNTCNNRNWQMQILADLQKTEDVSSWGGVKFLPRAANPKPWSLLWKSFFFSCALCIYNLLSVGSLELSHCHMGCRVSDLWWLPDCCCRSTWMTNFL